MCGALQLAKFFHRFSHLSLKAVCVVGLMRLLILPDERGDPSISATARAQTGLRVSCQHFPLPSKTFVRKHDSPD